MQTLQRALDVLEAVGRSTDQPSTLAQLAAATSLPAPTVHRLARTLVERGYLRHLPDKRYALGFRVVPLAAQARSQVGSAAQDVLASLVADLGETANLAVLAGHQAEYVAQVPSAYRMRMFTEIGRRVDLHSTGVGKALLAQLEPDAVQRILTRAGMTPLTDHTVRTPEALESELARIRDQGYACDEQEQEIGVRCVAVALPASLGMAVSVSGPLTRMSDALIGRAVPLLTQAAERLAEGLER